MARFGGRAALRAALGGVAGGLEGLGAMREQQRLAEEQRLARERQAMLDARQMEATRLAQELATRTEQRQALGMGMVPTTQFDTGGVAGGRDMPGATPRAPVFRQTIGETEFAMGETPDVKQHREELLKRREAQRTQDTNVQALVDAGVPMAQARAAVRLGAKYSDVTETPADRQRRLADERRFSLDERRVKLAEGAAGGDALGKEQSAMQQMMIARVNTARAQATAANAEMEKFEEELISGKRKIGAIEAQLANEMFKDTRFNRIAEARLNRMNPALAMYVRNAKAIGAAERLVMPRGGSNLLMTIETALAGVGPGATPELIRNTQAFRRGLVEGVQKETPEALMGAENARLESAIGTDAERRGISAAGVGSPQSGRPPLSSFDRR